MFASSCGGRVHQHEGERHAGGGAHLLHLQHEIARDCTRLHEIARDVAERICSTCSKREGLAEVWRRSSRGLAEI